MAETLPNVVSERLLSKLLSLAAEEVSLALGFRGDLERQAERMEMIQALLLDAENKQVSMSSVQLWLKNLKAIVYDADVVLDEFAYEVLRRKIQIKGRIKNKVRDFVSPITNPLLFRLQMAHKIKNINLLLDESFKKATEIGLKAVELINTTVEPREIRQTHPYVDDDSKVVGRDDDVSTILDMLLGTNNEKDLAIVSIMGMPGQGKTTLAQLIYKNDKVARHFDERIWVCVSDDYDVKRILNEMVQSLTRTGCNMSNIEAMIKRLQENLSGKKYLLVLDDVWNEIPEKWESMRNSLLGVGGSSHSKIIVTTRSDIVVSTMQTSLTYCLVGLSDDDSWTMFKQRAFADGGAIETPNLVAIGRRIVERCGGVPLAIKALGGLMHSKKYEDEWLSIQDSRIWDSPENIISGVLPTLKLSYDHLPSSSLKHCFAYCSILPKDSDIGKDTLVQLWMALGLLHPPKGSNLVMEDMGNSYFNTLLWNSLLQDAEKDEYDNITSCRMHDLVYDLALHTLKNYCATLDASKVNDDSGIQHLSIPEISKESFQRLQTLILKGDLLANILTKFECLCVLILVNYGIKELPSSIGKLKHLRYLDISATGIDKLPDNITKLYNLQTLRVKYQRELPKRFGNLINLRHFCFESGGCMLIGVGQLTCLQTLPYFVVSQESGCKLEELGDLNNLRGKLEIYRLQDMRNMEEAKSANLSSKSNVHTLGFYWGSRSENEDYNDEHVLEGLKPHSNLKDLKIENFKGVNFASWMVMENQSLLVLHNLVKIKLENCNRCEQIPTLGDLLFLKVIEINGMDSVKHIGVAFYGQNHNGASSSIRSEIGVAIFLALRELTLWEMPNLEQWLETTYLAVVSTNVFPYLQELEIKGCNTLTTVPGHFPILKKLRIQGINNSLALENMSNKLTSLTSLDIKNVRGSELLYVLEELLGNNRSLRELTIYSYDELSSLPANLQNLVALERLGVFGCANLTSIADELYGLTSLQRLSITDCDKVTCLPMGLQTLVSLESLIVAACHNVMAIPDINCLVSLQALDISSCEKLSALPSGLEVCISLEELTIAHFPALVSVPDLRCLTRLRRLVIGDFSEELDYFP